MSFWWEGVERVRGQRFLVRGDARHVEHAGVVTAGSPLASGRASADEDGSGAVVTVLPGEPKRGQAVDAAGGQIGTSGQQLTDDAEMIVLGSEHQRGAQLIVGGVWIRIAREQEPHNLILSGVGCIHERGVAVIVLRLDGDALLNEARDRLLITTMSCRHERGRAAWQALSGSRRRASARFGHAQLGDYPVRRMEHRRGRMTVLGEIVFRGAHAKPSRIRAQCDERSPGRWQVVSLVLSECPEVALGYLEKLPGRNGDPLMCATADDPATGAGIQARGAIGKGDQGHRPGCERCIHDDAKDPGQLGTRGHSDRGRCDSKRLRPECIEDLRA